MDNQHEQYVDWMHPSWRDLVIEHLAKNEEARQRFLSNCSSKGFLLALSTAGGATGERHRPLLLRPKDWQALQSSVTRVHASGFQAQYSVLIALMNALRTQIGRDDSDKLEALARIVLDDLRARWSNDNSTLNASILEHYFLISEELSPLPPAPDLGETWQGSWNYAESKFEEFDPSSSNSEIEAIEEWAHLANVVQDNEPRFLRQIDFHDNFDEVAKSFLDAVEQHVQEHFSFDSSEEHSRQEDRLDTLNTILTRLSILFPTISNHAQQVARRVVRRKSEHEESRMELEAKERSESNSKHKKYDQPAASTENNIGIIEELLDINKLFDDL